MCMDIDKVKKNLRNNWPRRFHQKVKVSSKIYGTKDRRLNKVNPKTGDQDD